MVTNGITAAHVLGEMNIKVYVPGGLLINNSSVLVGSDAEAFIDRLNADICFISCKGLGGRRQTDGHFVRGNADPQALSQKLEKENRNIDV